MSEKKRIELFDPRNPPSVELQNRQESIWLPPNPQLSKWKDIFAYAITFDGYAYTKDMLGVECGDLANSRLEEYQERGQWSGTFEELRCCLFFEQRRYHHFGRGPNREEAKAIKALHKAIISAWQQARRV